MKKNLFLLFSVYFFVLQAIVVGILRKESNFFWLGGINLLAIALIGIIYNSIEHHHEDAPEHKPHHEATPEHKPHHEPRVLKEPKVIFHNYLYGNTKEQKKKSELYFPFVISFLIIVGIFLLFQYNSTTIETILLFSILLWFIVFITLTLLLKDRFTKWFFALLGTKIYILLFVCSSTLVAYDYHQVNKELPLSFWAYITQNFLGKNPTHSQEYVFTGEWQVLWSGQTETLSGEEQVSSDLFSGMTIDSDIQEEETGTVLWTSTDVEEVVIEPETPSTIATTKGNQKIMDAVIYLLKKHNIPLITKHDLSFTYVSFKNENYDYWRTAYANKLIWKTTNPSKYIVCESYIVMKGILEKRNVPYTSSTVLTKFRAEAQKRNALNGCVKGKIVTDETL